MWYKLTAVLSAAFSLMAVPSANADSAQDFAQELVARWGADGYLPGAVEVDSASTAWCATAKGEVFDPYAITCSSTLIRFNATAVNTVSYLGARTLAAHEVGHVVLNQSKLRHSGDVEPIADCLAGVSLRAFSADLDAYTSSMREWLPKVTADERMRVFSTGYLNAAEPMDCLRQAGQ